MPKFTVPNKLKIQRKGGMELIETLYRIVKAGKKGITAGYGCGGYDNGRAIQMLITFGLITESERLVQSKVSRAASVKAARHLRQMTAQIAKTKTPEEMAAFFWENRKRSDAWSTAYHTLGNNRPVKTRFYTATKEGIKVCNEAEVTLVGGEETVVNW